MKIDGPRLHASLEALAQIGARADGGVCRLAFSDVDKAGRHYVEARMRALGLTIYIDPIGNIAGIRPGRSEAPVVLMGSHTDTVATGGRYDGSLGVLAALEVMETLEAAGVETEKPVGVVSFVNEEGVRFMPDMMGSLYWTEQLALDAVRQIKGTDGSTIGEELDRTQYAGSDHLPAWPVDSFLELHIEQGPVLENAGESIGVVEAVQGLIWKEFKLTGQANHAGTTPMAVRRNAGLAAARITDRLHRMAMDEIAGLRVTVGSMHVQPNLINVIPSEAVFTVDVRHPDGERLDEAVRRLRTIVNEIAEEEGVSVSERQLAEARPVQFDERVVGAVETAAKATGEPWRRMISGAGHDAQIMASRHPAGMIFIPSRDGISHNPAEYSTPASIEAGAQVLLQAVLQLAGGRGAR